MTGATIAEMSRILGISENAVLQRIKRGTLPGVRDGQGKWRVSVASTDQRPTNDRPTNYGTSDSFAANDLRPPLQFQQESAALIIREAIAPFVERLEAVHQELGTIRATLAQECRHREEIEIDRDALRQQVEELKSHLQQASAPILSSKETVSSSVVADARAAPKNRSLFYRFFYGDHDPTGLPTLR